MIKNTLLTPMSLLMSALMSVFLGASVASHTAYAAETGVLDMNESSTCTVEKLTCLQGAETRIINGVAVYRDCWQYEKIETCPQGENIDYCAPLKEATGCTLQSTECLASSAPGTCSLSESRFHCESPLEPVPEGITAMDVITDVTDAFETERYCPQHASPDCNVKRTLCTAPDETRVVDGVEVTLPCWEMSTDYVCMTAPDNPSCSLLEAAGCTREIQDEKQNARQNDNPDMKSMSDTGSSILNSLTASWSLSRPLSTPEIRTSEVKTAQTHYYACSDSVDVPAHDDIIFNERFPVLDAVTESSSSCESGCAVTQRVCVETHPLFSQVCVTEALTRLCTGTTDPEACAPLKILGCTLKTDNADNAHNAPIALNTLSTQSAEASEDYVCHTELTPLPQNITEIARNEIYTGMREDSDCPSDLGEDEEASSLTALTVSGVSGALSPLNTAADIKPRARCSVASRVCLEGPETRIVNGIPVYKDCWRTEVTYQCEGADTVNSCSDLSTDETCTLETQTCLAGTDKNCSLWTYTYRCQVKPDQTVVEEQCSTSICQHGLCTPTDDAPNTNLTDTIAKLEIGRQAAVYGDYDGLRFFSGTPESCRNKLGGVSCCKGKVRASYSNDNALGASYIFASQVARETVKTLGSPYVNDILMKHDVIADTMTKLYGEAAMQAYSPSLSYYGLTLSYSAGSLQFSFDPWTFFAMVAVDVATDYLSCTQEEQALQLKKGAQTCLYVGSVCTEFNLGKCQTKTESYCCYNSRLARLVQEAAHEQLGLSWGEVPNADCRGLTAYEFSQLDLSALDIEELRAMIAEETPGSVNIDQAATRARDRTQTLKTDPYAPMPDKDGVCANGAC